jgi:nucleotide-binding universal stress UspA family protein
MDSIVVGFDGSDASFGAVDWVAARASRKPCRVRLVRVEAAPLVDRDLDEIAFEEAERRLHALAPDTEVTGGTVGGRMPEQLLDAAQEADLLVIGENAGRPVRSAITGWKPLRVAARSSVPTVVVPVGVSSADGPVVVGVDDDDSSATAVEVAAREALAADVALTLVHAWRAPAPTMDGSLALISSPIAVKAEHRRMLDDIQRRVVSDHPRLKVAVLLAQDNPVAALLNAATRSSLLVVGTHHRGVVASAFLGSVTQDVLALSQVPVCIAPHVSPTT